MKRIILLTLTALMSIGMQASTTLPLKGTVINPTDKNIQYIGRICFDNPERPRFTFPGTQINVRFTGTSLKLWAKPKSGYFMAQVDEAEPFKVALMGERDSVVTVATALPQGKHTLRLMYVIEGYELKPDFRGFILDKGATLLSPPALPERKIEFIGNSITCGYGNESIVANDPFEYETENHYLTYAQLTSRALEAQAYVVARSGIGVYRSYDGPKTGTPENVMTTEYEYTNLYDRSEKWDFSRYQPQLVCINLGTNDLSTNNYDVKLLKAAYKKFLSQVRSHHPKAKIVYLCGSMLGGKELEIAKKTLNEVVDEANKAGDKEVYRFDFTPQTGDIRFGASWHPSVWQHQKMAAELTAYLRSLMQWF
ncbi:MAG: lipase [Prevotella sp.]|nr:lipase [Prevotella sp.]